jgi:hypothetical protein
MHKKITHYGCILIALLACCVSSACSDDNDDINTSDGKTNTSQVSAQTLHAIRETFTSIRLDSIHSHDSFGNIKIEYDGDLLVSYKECYNGGSVHDGSAFDVKWSKDTVYVIGVKGTFRAVIGNNGCVASLICPCGKTNNYEYDSERNLIRYDVNIADPDCLNFNELDWQDGNVTKCKQYYKSSDSDEIKHRRDLFYGYDTTLNIAGILTPFDTYSWIEDEGYSIGYGVNTVLYYAGLIGNRTKNIPNYSANLWESGNSNQRYYFTYQLNEYNAPETVFARIEYGNKGYYTEESDSYFYTE